ncbi:MAG: signal peptide peptidase SppA [Deltaproteobacteria bacterium]|nr:signal peptide peptidase SppA [Deltaproteobacteria bacterium]
MKQTARQSALTILAILALFVTASCSEEKEAPDEPVVRELRLLQAFPDGAEHDPFSRPEPTLHDVLTRIWDATEDENVKGLFVRVGPLQGAWGSVGDLIEALREFRAEDRPVHCHFEAADNVGYLLLASTCDRISMSPAGTLDLVGPAAVMIYARTLLEKVGVQAEIIHMGRYKGAGDMFIRDDMPKEAKASMDAILDDLYGALIEATNARTDGNADKAKGLIDGGPYASAAAAEVGLVDSVSFLRDAREEIKKAAGVDTIRRTRMLPKQEQLTLGQFLKLFSGESEKPEASGERIALVFVNGNITDGESGSTGDAVSGPFVRAMERLEDDENVKAVVMRINSPGGSALASDRMWDAARHLAAAKPLIASVGDMAASGGYYIASAATEILAHPNSLVGSIGVVGGKFNFAGLAEDIGVNTYILQRGKRAAWSTPVRPLSATERQAFESLLRDTYDRFIDRVAAGRKMERAAVLAAAEGRVMTGQDGKELGLIDEMAGLSEALTRARAAAGLAPDAPVELWPPTRGMIDAINELLSGNGDDGVQALQHLRSNDGQTFFTCSRRSTWRWCRLTSLRCASSGRRGRNDDRRAAQPHVLSRKTAFGGLFDRARGHGQAALAYIDRPPEGCRPLAESAKRGATGANLEDDRGDPLQRRLVGSGNADRGRDLLRRRTAFFAGLEDRAGVDSIGIDEAVGQRRQGPVRQQDRDVEIVDLKVVLLCLELESIADEIALQQRSNDVVPRLAAPRVAVRDVVTAPLVRRQIRHDL